MNMREWLRRIRAACTKENMRNKMKRWGRFLLNPRLLLCLFIAWMVTNGWSYILFAIGILLKINWMRIVAGTYMSLLWLPFTPEKIITLFLAIGLLRLLYPRDERTLGVLRRKLKSLRRNRTAE